MNTYVRKENKFAQTDQTKYDFSNAGDNARDWTMKRNLEDAELLLQNERNLGAEAKDHINHVEQKCKKLEMELQAAKRDALNQKETNNRMKEQLQDYMHKMNLYKIESQELIKQIDLADAKTREKEDEVRLMEAEYDRKLKL